MTIVGLVALAVGLGLGTWFQWSLAVEEITELKCRLKELERRLIAAAKG